MPILEYIKIELNCQGFEVKQLSFSPEKDRSVAMLESVRKTSDMKCPDCGEAVHIYDKFDITLKDMPIYPDVPLSLFAMVIDTVVQNVEKRLRKIYLLHIKERE